MRLLKRSAHDDDNAFVPCAAKHRKIIEVFALEPRAARPLVPSARKEKFDLNAFRDPLAVPDDF